ncbi:MAG: hypothetical protein WB612_09575, partial [Nitrososphaeraceae archaeon]
ELIFHDSAIGEFSPSSRPKYLLCCSLNNHRKLWLAIMNRSWILLAIYFSVLFSKASHSTLIPPPIVCYA